MTIHVDKITLSKRLALAINLTMCIFRCQKGILINQETFLTMYFVFLQATSWRESRFCLQTERVTSVNKY